MTHGPSSEDLEQLLAEALAQPVAPKWRRLTAAVRGLPAWLAQNGGYWGGVIMHGLRRSASAAAAHLRRT